MLINVAAAFAAGARPVHHRRRHHDRRQHLRLHRRQGGAARPDADQQFGGFWDSVIDRFSDIALFIGLIYLYSTLGRTDYVMVASLAMMFSIMTSYTRARAESLIEKCKVGFMERPERIVLFMIGAFTNRMAARAVGDPGAVDLHRRRPHHPTPTATARTRARGGRMSNPARRCRCAMLWNAFFWTYERATWQYDLMVIAILAFVWLTPPDWLGDPMASGGMRWLWLLDFGS